MHFHQVLARFTLSIGVVIVSVMQFSNHEYGGKICQSRGEG